MVQAFDLNVEKVLEHWSPAHALREVIANALDEHALAGQADLPQIVKDDAGVWHVRDFGRGLRYQHLTQNESAEKRTSDVVVGQFGVGLKDALATFHRNGIGVRISSPHGTIGLVEQSKHGFGDVVTLHALVDVPADIDGTDVALAGISDAAVAEAMAFFLVFDDTVSRVGVDTGRAGARPTRGGAAQRVRAWGAGRRGRRAAVLVQRHEGRRQAAPCPEPGTVQRRTVGVHRSDQGDPPRCRGSRRARAAGHRHGRLRQGGDS